MRDRTVTPFATMAERDLAVPVPKPGMVCITLDNDTMWVFRNTAWRVLYHPSLVEHHQTLALSNQTNTGFVLGMTPAPPAAPFATTQYLSFRGTAGANGNANSFITEFRTAAGVAIPPNPWTVKLAGPLAGGDSMAVVGFASRALAASVAPTYQFVYRVDTQNVAFTIECVSVLVPATTVV